MDNITQITGVEPQEVFNFLTGIMQAQSLANMQELINSLMEDEMFKFLEELNEGEKTGQTDKRNGYYTRKLNTRFGQIALRVPRDRFALFRTKLFGWNKRNTDDVDNIMMSLYRCNMSENEIVDHLMESYNLSMSRETIAKRVRNNLGPALEFKARRLPECVAVFMDATYVPIKRDGIDGKSVEKEAIEVCLGITREGRKEVLGFYYVPNEGASSWEEVLRDLRERGVGNPAVFVTDGLQGMPEAIGRVFPQSRHQTCLVHIQRNLSKGARAKDRKAIAEDFSAIYLQDDEAMARKALDAFVAKWEKAYPGLMKNLLSKKDLLTFYAFPEPLRAHIYTSNMIESFNAKLKRATRRKIILNSLDNADIVVAQCCMSYNKNCGLKRISGYSRMTAEEKLDIGFNI